ncbi:hypothetical protein [Clostridium grantii]|uniref:Uncharacterized protein n=1 Tax=Clostridium grantii DSM 8605 TaxID=1121316 RepID=A0A1M5WX62_9CLOT|nr:hypothetical protein [Clostridium grantii]SHH92295.1 hypothetical protein SAMN02745207_03199 [Clostridium grantii DSM 8605]
MDKKDQLILNLQGEIQRKCVEISEKKSEEMWTKFFILGCILFITLPIITIFIGINLLLLASPVIIYFAFCLLVLIPIMLNNKKLGGRAI